MCTYEDLVAATLPYGLAPLVVPQLKTITLGGAVTGLGIESTSFRNGLPHESVLEMDILTGAGEVVTASPDRARRPVPRLPQLLRNPGLRGAAAHRARAGQPFVALRHLRFHALADLVAAMDRIIETGGHDGVPVDYLDGVVFSADESYLSMGFQIGARHGQRLHRPADLLPVHPAPRRREGRPAHHSRLPVAVGHRLVLVFAGLRCAGPADPQALAAALPAQQLLLEADRLRPAVQHCRSRRSGTAGRPGARRAGHRGADRQRRGRVPPLVPGQRADRTDVVVSAAAAGRDQANTSGEPAQHRTDLAALPNPPDHTYVNVGFWSWCCRHPVPPTATSRAQPTS